MAFIINLLVPYQKALKLVLSVNTATFPLAKLVTENGLEFRRITLLHKLGNRVQALLNENRKEEFSNDEQRERRHPFIRSDGQSQTESRARHSNELLRRNVRGNQRGANGPPWQRFTG